MSKQIRKIIGIMLTVCITVSLLVGINLVAFAATEITSIVLTGDITPEVGKDMGFATAASNPNYTILQAWINVNTDAVFTNSTEYNNLLGERLMPEADRKFADGTTYSFNLFIIPTSADVKFVPNVTVSVEPYGNMPFVDVDDNVACELKLNLDGDHVHVISSEYGKNDVEHWGRCVSNDGYIFDGSEEAHYFDGISGYCKYCGYRLSESDKTTITKEPEGPGAIACGSTLELTVEATGRNLRYVWRWQGEGNSDGSFFDSDNLWNSGMKVSVNGRTLKIENCNQYMENYPYIYCRVSGGYGEAETQKVSISVNHNSNLCTPIDATGHKVKCTCGEVITETARHLYSGDTCSSCGYKKGDTQVRVKEMTLSLTDFSNQNTESEAKASAVLSGTGLTKSTNGIDEISFSSGIIGAIGETKFDKNTAYTVKIYPAFEDDFYIDDSEVVYVHYNGKTEAVTPTIDLKTRTYYLALSLKPYIRHEVIFDSNGGSGTQAALYGDEHNHIYFPECTFTKTDDEFYAWEYNGKLYPADPEENTFVYVAEETATVKAVWKSQRINRATVFMSYPKNGEKVSDIQFSVPRSCILDYSITGITWYEDNYQDITKDELGLKLSDNTVLNKNKNYNVKVTIKGNGNGFADNVKVNLNNRRMDEFEKTGLEHITFVIHIKGGADITLWEPIEGLPLTSASDMKIKSSILSIDNDNTYWTANEEGNWFGKYANGAVVTRENPYYLYGRLKYNAAATNSVIFGDTVLINGKEYKVDIWGEDCAVVIPQFEVRNLYMNVSETADGIIHIEAPKAMNAKFAMVLYDSQMCMNEHIWKGDLALSAGDNEVNIVNIDAETAMKIVMRESGRVKIMVFDGENELKPLCNTRNYVYKYTK